MNTEAQTTPLAIIGIGCLFPKAAGPGFYWANIKHGVDCIGEVPATHWDPADYYDADPKKPDMTYARRGGFLDAVDFNPLEFGIAPRDIEATDTTQLLGLVAAKQALTDAGVVLQSGGRQSSVSDTRVVDAKPRGADAPRSVDRSRVSVILGVTGTLELVIPLGARLGHPKWKRAMKAAGIPDEQIEDAAERIAESYVPWQENSFPGLLGNVVAGRIANRLDLGGTNCVVDAACASSLSAVHLAALELQANRADVVVTGGCDTFNDIFMYMCFSKTPALSATGNAKPFDANGDGTILGEGLGVVVLKRLADAERDGDTIYAVIRGIGSSSDGKGNAIYAPSADGQRRCLLNAYRLAGVTPDTIELVEAHGTGTKVGDATEATALTEVFSRDATRSVPWCALGSVKSQIGHTKAAAGAASLIKAALALYHKVLPPTIKVTTPVDPLNAPDSPFYVNATMRPWLPRAEHPRRAALSAFGFGGSNFHAVLEEYHAQKREVDWDGRVEIVALGAATPRDLAAALDKVPTAWNAFAHFAEQSRAAFDATSACRLCFAAHRTLTDLPMLLATAKAKLTADPQASWHTPHGVHFGIGPAGQLAVLFPGQGSQAVGMLRDLACLFPEMLESLAVANSAAPRLSDRIYPPTRFDPEQRKRDDAELRQTQNAQPALGAVSFGAWRVLSERFGLAADAFAGHSYGELVALAAAGRFSAVELIKLSLLRGQLMGEQRTGDSGAMLAVLAAITDIERVLLEQNLDLVIANRNAPNQTVLSGATVEIDRAEKAFAAAGLRAARLPVAAAFHSRFVADAAGPFRAALDEIPFPSGLAKVFANTTAREYPADPDAARDLLANQLAQPVAFVEQVRAMANAGTRVFLEVGPGTVLSKLLEATLSDAGVTGVETFAINPSGDRRPAVLDLGDVLARLAAGGHAVNLAAWERDSRCRPEPESVRKPGLSVPLTGANHVAPRPVRPPVSANGRYRPPSSMNPDASVVSPPMPEPDPNAVAQALQLTQQSLAALQRMQEQTASLHKQFLDSQEATHRTLQALVDQQQTLLLQGLGSGATLPPAALPQPVAPRPVVIAPPPLPAAPVPMPVPAAAPTPVPLRVAATPAPAPDRIAGTLLAVVSEKTGYPVESLDLSLSLDADLGVDSIKRVEILSTLQERLPEAPVVKPEHLGTLHTLHDVATFLAGTGDELIRTQPLSKEQLQQLAQPDSAQRPGASGGDIAGTLLAVVSEKTGYPVESLDLSLSLDADLGVDSIKRVEILSTLQERLPEAPVVKPEHLGTLHTLHDVATFLAGQPLAPATTKIPIQPVNPTTPAPAPGLAELTAPKTEQVTIVRPSGESSRSEAARQPASRSDTENPVRPPGSQLGTDRIDRSILQPVDLDLSNPRPRISLAQGCKIWIVGHPDPLTEAVATLVAAEGFTPTVFGWPDLAEAGASESPAGLVLLAPITPEPGLNQGAFEWLKLAGPKLRQAGRRGGALFVTLARLDGAFGLADLATDPDPAAGGLAGLAKTARHEWPEVACKAIDLTPTFTSPDAAAAVVDEILSAGPIEVGIAATHRCTLELARTVRRPASQLINLGAKDVILVTGGARGVTAEAAVALAETYSATLILTGRTPPPTPEPEWLAGLTVEADLKKAIAAKLGTHASPRQVGEYYQRVMAHREIRRTLERIVAAGAKVAYFPVNITDTGAVAEMLQQVRAKYGPVTAVVHGAGVLADKRLEDLTRAQFDTVYATKVDGLRNLLGQFTRDELKALVLFSSTTARFGRLGQAAYACANEVLNKTAQVEARRRPNCRVVAINWGPWDGGMVTPGLRKLFEAEGVGLIPLLEGAVFLVQELSAAGKSVEVISLGKQWGNSGIVPLPATTPPPMGLSSQNGSSAASTPAPAAEMILAFERTVDPVSHPVLKAHVIDSRAVLPMALHLEWLAHAALHGNPGLVFHGFNDLRVTQGIQIDSGAPVSLRAFAAKASRQDRLFVVPVELRGKRKDGREVIHSRAEIVLTSTLPPVPLADRPPPVSPAAYSVTQAYREMLFHGPELHGIERIDGVSESAFIATAFPAPVPADWFQFPLRSHWVADPLVLDASFQMMILWTLARHGAGSLPCFAGRYRQYRRGFPTGPVTVVIRIRRDDGKFARSDIDYLDADGRVIAQMQDYECVMEKSLAQAFRKNQLVKQ